MKKLLFIISLVMAVLISLNACNHDFDDDNEDENEMEFSEHGDDESHNQGQDCMSCHTTGGVEDELFTVAGSLFKGNQNVSFNSATVVIKNSTGDELTEIEVDAKGNFYTNKNIDFTEDIFTEVRYQNDTLVMISKISHGSCNTCHYDGDKVVLN